jgi:hypothetical protein
MSADDIGDRVNKFDSDQFDSYDRFDKYDSFDFFQTEARKSSEGSQMLGNAKNK